MSYAKYLDIHASVSELFPKNVWQLVYVPVSQYSDYY